MTASQDLLVLYRSASTRYHAAVTTAVESGDTCTLLVLGDGADWEDSVPAAFYARPMTGIAKGTSVGQWQPVPVTDEIAAAIATAVSGGLTGYATSGYVDDAVADLASEADVAAAVAGLASSSAVTAAITAAVSGLATAGDVTGAIATAEAYADTGDAARQALPGAGSSVSLAVNTARNPSSARGDSRPTRVTISGTWSWNLTAIGTQAGTATLKSDSSGTPSTTVASAPFSRGIGVGITVNDTGTMPWSWSYEVPVGHSYLIATSGTGTFSALTVVEQAI